MAATATAFLTRWAPRTRHAQWARDLQPIAQSLWCQRRRVPAASAASTKVMPVTQDDLGRKTMRESLARIIRPLQTHPESRRSVATFWGAFRSGVLLEDLDAVAAFSSYRYADGFSRERPLTIVTAAIDRINNDRSLALDRDVEIVGRVVSVGRSSMVVRVDVNRLINPNLDEAPPVASVRDSMDVARGLGGTGIGDVRPDVLAALPDGSFAGDVVGIDEAGIESRERVLCAYYTMVARDMVEHKAAAVPMLQITSEDERQQQVAYQLLKEVAGAGAARSVQSLGPTVTEQELLHQLFLATESTKGKKFKGVKNPMDALNLTYARTMHEAHVEGGGDWDGKFRPHGPLAEGDTLVPMEATVMKSTVLMHYQSANIHQKVFGGYICKCAFDLAWSNVYSFLGLFAPWLGAAPIMFMAPVDLGSIVEFTSTITYTGGDVVVCDVQADVVDPQSGSRQTTNTFSFSFFAPARRQTVVPLTYQDGSRLVQARRSAQNALEHARQTGVNIEVARANMLKEATIACEGWGHGSVRFNTGQPK